MEPLTSESQDSNELDEVNPNQVIYDLENNQVVIPKSEDEIVYENKPLPKFLVKDVSNTRYRNSR